MADFLMLGLVPGTNIQITFMMWTTVTLSLLACVFAWRLYQARFVFARAIITLAIYSATHRRLRA
jgi:TM2 domain-containing membrane protein YozV